MLEVNQEHIGADISSIKTKISRVKNIGKVLIGGIALSSTLVLSGCGHQEAETTEITEDNVVEADEMSTAIIMENGNAMIVDITAVVSLQVYSEEYYENKAATLVKPDKIYGLKTASGDEIIVDYDSFKVISGENAHEKAEMIAQSLISADGKITCYDEVESYGLSY